MENGLEQIVWERGQLRSRFGENTCKNPKQIGEPFLISFHECYVKGFKPSGKVIEEFINKTKLTKEEKEEINAYCLGDCEPIQDNSECSEYNPIVFYKI